MQLERLKIQNFRNLRDFEITFTGKATDADGSERPFKSHAVIGQNGTGKSNMIEAIVTIFRDLDLNQKTEFAYQLDYTCRGHHIQVDAMGEKGKVTVTEPWRNTLAGGAGNGCARCSTCKASRSSSTVPSSALYSFS